VLGINSWTHEPGELKEAMTKENITWRTFDDEGAINTQWNFPLTPAFVVIDHRGVIRRKWVGNPGQKAIDAALAKLIQVAEASSD